MKIVSLLPSATEIVCSLGLEKSLVAVTHECDFPPQITHLPAITASRISHETMSSKDIDHAVRSQLDGHGTIYDLDTDKLQSLQPDIILTQELCDVCAVSYKIVEKAAKMYVADASVLSLEPNTLDDIFDNIVTVADLAEHRSEGERLAAQLRLRLADVAFKLKNVPQKPDVFMLEWLEPPFAPGHWVPEQVQHAGGTPLLSKAGKPSVTTTFEAIRESNPDVLVLNPCGYYIADILRQLGETAFPANWRTMKAFANNQVWAMDATSYFSRPGPRVVDGVEILAKVLHPEIFGNPNDVEAVRVPLDKIKFAA